MVTVRVKVVPLAYCELVFKNLSFDCDIDSLKEMVHERLSLDKAKVNSYFTFENKVLHPTQKISCFQFGESEFIVSFHLETFASESGNFGISKIGLPFKLHPKNEITELDKENLLDKVETEALCCPLSNNNASVDKVHTGDMEEEFVFEAADVCEAEEPCEVVVECEAGEPCEVVDEEVSEEIVEKEESLLPSKKNYHFNSGKETRATVRYYSRMNPDKVFPLTVLFSENVFDIPENEDIGQKESKRFKIKTEIPVEIEPIIPGCFCFPQKQTVFVSANTRVVFHIVPKVTGELHGAVVDIRQGQVSLSTISLDINVTKQTLAIVMGYASFVMPAFSIGLKFLNLDFDSQKSVEYEDYQKIFKFFFIWLPPWVQFLLLGIIFLIFWLLTKPEQQEEFWTLKKLDSEKLYEEMRLAFSKSSDEGWRLLKKLIELFPTFSKGHAFYGKLQYEASKYKQALIGFRKAIELGDTSPATYFFASLSASKIGLNQEACDILCSAKSTLPDEKFNHTISYNLGCYFARLGLFSEAFEAISIAIKKGFSNQKLLLTDPDLHILRNQVSFKLILNQLTKP